MTEIQNGLMLTGFALIVWNVITINIKLFHIKEHLFVYSTPPREFERLASKGGSITDNQEIISNQLDNLNHQLMALREDNEIPKVLRQIRHYVSGGTVEEMKEMEGWHSEYS